MFRLSLFLSLSLSLSPCLLFCCLCLFFSLYIFLLSDTFISYYRIIASQFNVVYAVLNIHGCASGYPSTHSLPLALFVCVFISSSIFILSYSFISSPLTGSLGFLWLSVIESFNFRCQCPRLSESLQAGTPTTLFTFSALCYALSVVLILICRCPCPAYSCVYLIGLIFPTLDLYVVRKPLSFV